MLILIAKSLAVGLQMEWIERKTKKIKMDERKEKCKMLLCAMLWLTVAVFKPTKKILADRSTRTHITKPVQKYFYVTKKLQTKKEKQLKTFLQNITTFLTLLSLNSNFVVFCFAMEYAYSFWNHTTKCRSRTALTKPKYTPPEIM